MISVCSVCVCVCGGVIQDDLCACCVVYMCDGVISVCVGVMSV